MSADGQPDVVPIAFEYDGACFWLGGPGDQVLTTRKFRNVLAGEHEVALVIDDLPSFDPFIARASTSYLRITPKVSWSWNLAGEPAGDTWYESHRAVHGA